MKVEYLGVYRDGTGWGRAAIDYMMALHTAGVDVVARPIKLNSNTNVELPEAILEMEKKDARGSDVVIQHILPHLMDYNGLINRNIGLYVYETTNFKMSSWPRRINHMDEAWVPNHQIVRCSIESGVDVPINIVHHTTDMNKFQKGYEPLPIKEELAGDFVFYFIGESIRRKNIGALIKAFHLEFSRNEPVQLMIKTSMSGMSPKESKANLMQFCNELKTNMKLYKDPSLYKQELIITERLSDEDMMRLHATGDCFVSPSFGEAWGIPAFDAMAMGKTPIVTNWGGFTEYMNNARGWMVDFNLEPVIGMTNSFQDLYTSRENWASVDINHLRQCMRDAYESTELRKTLSQNGIRAAYDFSYEAVGKQMKELLENG